MSATAKQVLTMARAHCELEWGQGIYDGFPAPGRTCVAMAISDAAYWLNVPYLEAHLAFENAIGEGIIVIWNDDPRRTLPEVLAAFDRAIGRTPNVVI